MASQARGTRRAGAGTRRGAREARERNRGGARSGLRHGRCGKEAAGSSAATAGSSARGGRERYGCTSLRGDQAPVALRARWASEKRTPRGARQGLLRGRCGAKAAGRAAIAARAGSQRQGFTSSRQEARRREPLGARCEARKKIHHAMCTQKSAARQMQRAGNGVRGGSSACTGGKRHGFTRSHHEAHRPEPLARKACSRESTPRNER